MFDKVGKITAGAALAAGSLMLAPAAQAAPAQAAPSQPQPRCAAAVGDDCHPWPDYLNVWTELGDPISVKQTTNVKNNSAKLIDLRIETEGRNSSNSGCTVVEPHSIASFTYNRIAAEFDELEDCGAEDWPPKAE